MHFCLENKSVSLSAGELAAFGRMINSHAPSASASQLETGQLWHRELHQKARSTEPDALIEFAFDHTLFRQGWRIRIQGRIDQILPHKQLPSGRLIREIKTTRRILPQPIGDLLECHPDYVNQLATYQQVLSQLPSFKNIPVEAELLFVNTASGNTQSLPLSMDTCAHAFERQFQRLLVFLNDRLTFFQQKSLWHIQWPFDSSWSGQDAVRKMFPEAFQKQRILAFDAPTGFGKTAIALEFALHGLRSGQFERILFLSSKGTGQENAEKAIQQLFTKSPQQPRFYRFRNKYEHAISTPQHACNPLGTCQHFPSEDESLTADACITFLQQHAHLTIEEVREWSTEHGCCPYEASRQLLRSIDVWIGDFNYIFHPTARSVFYDQLGFNPDRSLLILDEAHHLAERVCLNGSFVIDAEKILQLGMTLRYLGASHKLLHLHDQLHDRLYELPINIPLDEAVRLELIELIESVCREADGWFPEASSLFLMNADALWDFYHYRKILKNPALTLILHCAQKGVLQVDCIQASSEIRTVLESFAGVIAMSATLGPRKPLLQRWGLPAGSVEFVTGTTDWRHAAYNIAVDLRVSTRYRDRDRFHGVTAETIGLMKVQTQRPLIAFFPSYAYAKTVMTHFSQLHPEFSWNVQPQNVSPDKLMKFLDESLNTTDVISLILGGSLGESVDHLGGRIDMAIIVGPALPEVNLLQQAKIQELEHLGREEAFHQVYQIPGMTRINQALGRLARHPDHRAKVLLHCQRFSEVSYRNLLAPEYQDCQFIRNRDDLNKWLAETQTPFV
jgi:Rad3-related DNA helicase